MAKSARAGLSKSRLLVHRQCPKRLWLQTNKPDEAEVDLATANVLATGNEVGAIARTLFPGGVLIETNDLGEALAETRSVLAARPDAPIFEATFEHDDVLVRCDVLLPEKGGHRMVEVKSSTKVKDYHVPDVAIQSVIASAAGLNVRSLQVAHLDSKFVYQGGGNYEGLFKSVDVTDLALEYTGDVPKWIVQARETLASSEPNTGIGAHCHEPFACPFHKYCGDQQGIERASFPVEDLPHASRLIGLLRADGYTDIRDVPEERLPKPAHRRIREAAITGQQKIDPAAAAAIKALGYPRYYMDFETLQSAIPIWAGTRPYVSQVPFQWSCHIETGPGELQPESFLASGSDDPRQAFAESLTQTIGETGPVLVYNAAFERARLQELARLFPDMAERLQSIAKRIVDLLPLARAHYYHRDMHGSWSLKAVAPTIAPELGYDGLAVGNGEMAQSAFREILNPSTTEERRAALRADLLEYCGRDTLLLVHLAQLFLKADESAGQSQE
ncbi:MAG TPA: DUF2779 domain-containing protein [Verrucomicrobiae bacterium]|nr:DUF2779 domain-containing protein [Verrucomicrobiae bacterium]